MSKKLIIILTLAALILFFVIYEWGRNTSSDSTINQSQTPTTNTPSVQSPNSNTNSNINTNKNIPTKTTTTKTGTGTKLTYGEAINTYKNRIQFVDCNGIVNGTTVHTLTVLKNTPIMLDNRDKITHTIVAQGQKISINSYDYKIFYPKSTGPSTITCDGRNSVSLNVN